MDNVYRGAFKVQEESQDPALIAEQQASAERRFFRALLSRATPVTYFILILNFFIFLLMSTAGNRDLLTNVLWGADQMTLIAFGAKLNHLINSGQWFRF